MQAEKKKRKRNIKNEENYVKMKGKCEDLSGFILIRMIMKLLLNYTQKHLKRKSTPFHCAIYSHTLPRFLNLLILLKLNIFVLFADIYSKKNDFFFPPLLTLYIQFVSSFSFIIFFSLKKYNYRMTYICLSLLFHSHGTNENYYRFSFR